MRYINRAKQSFRLWVRTGIFIGFAILGCNAAEPVRIGFVAGTSGRVADLGISGRDAAQLVVEQCNLDSGIAGRQVQLLFKDDQQNPDIARKVVQDLIEEGVAAIVGPMTSDMALAVAPILNEARVLTVSPTATTQHLSGFDDYFSGFLRQPANMPAGTPATTLNPATCAVSPQPMTGATALSAKTGWKTLKQPLPL